MQCCSHNTRVSHEMRIGDGPAASSLSQVTQVGSHGSLSSRGDPVLDRLQVQLYIQIKYMVSKHRANTRLTCSDEKERMQGFLDITAISQQDYPNTTHYF